MESRDGAWERGITVVITKRKPSKLKPTSSPSGLSIFFSGK